MSDPSAGQADSINFINENYEKDLEHSDTLNLQDPDGQFEEELEAEGAFIIESTTRFPASGTTISKRSLTPKEWAEQRQHQD